MKTLVANLGSTSFKYRLFDQSGAQERLLAKGGSERVSDYEEAIEQCLSELLQEGAITGPDEIDAVGFKTVLGKNLSGCVIADERALDALEGFEAVAPAHNPAYARGIRSFAKKLPNARRVALFETSFYQWAPESAQRYAIPESWEKAGVRRYGFHGASHKYVAERAAELLGRDDVAERVRRLYVDGPGAFEGPPLRMVSCHLGGSSSVTGVDTGVAIGSSMGFSPQGGLPQNNRVGDLDSMAVPYAVKTMGITVEEAERQLTKEGGLLGLSGVGNDMRDIREAAKKGDARAQLAIDSLVWSIRHWTGAFAWQMGGLEAIVFTAGIGENNPWLREAALEGLEGFGVTLDKERNGELAGSEGSIHATGSKIPVLVIPTNEELVVARETKRLLESAKARA